MIILVGIVSVSCDQIQTKIEAGRNYKLDIDISNKPSGDQYIAEGMIVLPKKSLYTITFEADNKITFISFRTCSREITAQDPSVHLNRRKYQINYAPNEIEAAGNCPTMISAFNEKGMVSVGMIAYENDINTMPAEVICGERTEKTNGVSVCQGRVTSLERIKFTEEMAASPDKDCLIESGNRGKEFTYKIKDGFCNIVFVNIKDQKKTHVLYTYGYSDIQIR